jgi:diketogulonate reductase-like aldo/keto reductase
MVKYPIDYRDRKPLGKSGESIPAIGIGTWAVKDYGRAEKVLIKAVELGLSLIDTAEMYGNGRAEIMVGNVVKAVGKENVFIITKMLPEHLRSRDEVVKAGKASLKRLGLDSVDLFLIHWVNPYLGIGRQVRNFEALIDEGIARYIVVSNFSPGELAEAVSATHKADIVADQVHYSVLHREFVEDKLLPKALELGVTLQAYTPLERCDVSRSKVVREVARRVGKTPVQVALNYLISRPGVVAIPKTERMDHLQEIADSLGWRLDEGMIEILEKA